MLKRRSEKNDHQDVTAMKSVEFSYSLFTIVWLSLTNFLSNQRINIFYTGRRKEMPMNGTIP